MSTYFIGDIHGCFNEFNRLLDRVSFNVKYDYLWLTGDLIDRGPGSLEVINLIMSLGTSIKMVLGNHDLNLIAIYANVKKETIKSSIISNLLKFKKIDEIIFWLRHQPLVQIDDYKKIIMVHAGIYPYWDINLVKYYSKKIEMMLCHKYYDTFLKILFNNKLINKKDCLSNEINSLSFALNVFTRMRYCLPNGDLDMTHKQSPTKDILPLLPWFSIKNNNLNDYSIFFGHWASLKENVTPFKIIPLDTGCCWGGKLSMYCLETKDWFFEHSKINKL